METLRKAVQDNREVFVSVINNTTEELEGRYNGFVEDLEKIINEMYTLQLNVESCDKLVKEETQKLNKGVFDLESHINTQILTEKSSRKAQDQFLAESIDKFQRAMKLVTEKI